MLCIDRTLQMRKLEGKEVVQGHLQPKPFGSGHSSSSCPSDYTWVGCALWKKALRHRPNEVTVVLSIQGSSLDPIL